MWWILAVVALLVLFWWWHTQYELKKCMMDAANPASPTHRLTSEFGWQKETLFKLYLARRSIRNNNTLLGMKEVHQALDMSVQDFLAHGTACSSTSPLTLIDMTEEQSRLAMSYALDAWKEDRSRGNRPV